MKLGLILKITNGGENETYSINKQEAWARYASDARTAIKELQGFDGNDKTVYLLKFLGGVGYFLSVIKSRPEGSGRPNDNTAAWIFVPSAAVVSATEMEQVLKNVEEAISESKGVDNAKLEETFSNDYATKNVLVSAVGTISSAADGNYALRYYNGDYNLNELLGDHLAQSEYARYKGVFFAENKSGIVLSTNDVLNFEPKQFITISPLKSVGGFVAGFSSLKGFAKFDKDIELATGTKITIEWHKENYAPIVKTFTAGADNTASLEIKDTERFVRIQRSWFKVQDFHGISIQNASVSINHQLITGDYLDIAESMLLNNGISIDIQADGYEDFHDVQKVLSPNKTIKLHHRKYHTEFNVPIYDGENHIGDAKLTFESFQRLNKSPLRGYDIQGHNLVYSVRMMSKFKTFAYGFTTCVLIILLYVGAQAMEEYEFQVGWPPFKHMVQQEPEESNPGDGDVEEAQNDSVKIQYLDANKSWNKESLDAHEETKGLFDELNEFKLDALKKRIAEKKLSSQNLQNIVDALQRNYDNGYDPHIGKMSSNGGNYNSMSDKTINIDNYIQWLSIQHSEPTHEDNPVTDTNKKETSKVSTPSKITGESTKKETGKKKEAKTEKSQKKDTSKNDSKNTGGSKKSGSRGEV